MTTPAESAGAEPADALPRTVPRPSVHIVEQDGTAWVDTRSLTEVCLDNLLAEMARQGRTSVQLAAEGYLTPVELDEILAGRAPLPVANFCLMAEALGQKPSTMMLRRGEVLEA